MKSNYVSIATLRKLQLTSKTPFSRLSSDSHEQQMQRRVRLLRPSWKMKPRAISVIQNGNDLCFKTQNSLAAVCDKAFRFKPKQESSNSRNETLFTNDNIRAYLTTSTKKTVSNATAMNFMSASKNAKRQESKFFSLDGIARSNMENVEVSVVNISPLLSKSYNSPERLKELLLPLNRPKDATRSFLSTSLKLNSTAKFQRLNNPFYLKCKRMLSKYVGMSKPMAGLNVSSVLKGISLYLHNKIRKSSNTQKYNYPRKLTEKVNGDSGKRETLPKCEFRVNVRLRKGRYATPAPSKEYYNFRL